MAVNVTIKIKTNNLFFFSFFFNEKNVLRRWQFVIVIFRYSCHFPFHFMKEIRFLKCNKITKCFVHSYKSQTNHCEGKAPIDKNVSISRHRYVLCYIQTFPLTKKKTTLCQTITPVSWWYFCTQVHCPKNRICHVINHCYKL